MINVCTLEMHMHHSEISFLHKVEKKKKCVYLWNAYIFLPTFRSLCGFWNVLVDDRSFCSESGTPVCETADETEQNKMGWKAVK